MIGSDTRIIVALRWTENSTPWRLASATCSARNACRASRRITAESRISPASTAIRSLSTVTAPSAATCSMRTLPSRSTVTDCSVARKSSAAIVDTCERESGDQGPIEWGWWRA